MPIYAFNCRLCGNRSDHFVSYEDRMNSQDCPDCEGVGSAEYQFPMASLGPEVKSGDNRLIWDERQVSSEKGEHWRDKGTTRKPGGAGQKLFFHD